METEFSDVQISDLLLRACHDLRSALRGVRTHSELLLRPGAQPLDPELERRLGFVVNSARRMDFLIEGLTNYSIALRTDASTFETVKLPILLRGALRKLDAELKARGAQVTYDELPEISGHADRLQQLLEQLLSNALEHSKEDAPRVHVSAEKQAEFWRIGVRDHGVGVDPATLEKIFEPFEHATAGAQSAGLGLTIGRAIIERHGGRIWAELPEDAGLVVYFTLPEQS
jgi:signal transduction histidine kinase